MVSEPTVAVPLAPFAGEMRMPQPGGGAVHSSKQASNGPPRFHLMFCDDESVPKEVLKVMAERMHHTWQPRKSVQELCVFIGHLQTDLECCYGTMVVATIYMQRLRHKFELAGVDTRDVSCQQLFMICMMIASKFVSDMPFTNQQWAESSGLSLQHVNHLERSTINALEFNLNVLPEKFLEGRSFFERLASSRTGRVVQGPHLSCGVEAALSAPAPALKRDSLPTAMPGPVPTTAKPQWTASSAAAMTKKDTPQPAGWAEYVADKLRSLNGNTSAIMAPILTADPLASLFRTSQPGQQPSSEQRQKRPSLSRMSSVSSTASTASIPAHLLPPLPLTSADSYHTPSSMPVISYPSATLQRTQMQRPPAVARQYYSQDLPAPRGSFAPRAALRPLAPKAYLPHPQPSHILNPFSMV